MLAMSYPFTKLFFQFFQCFPKTTYGKRQAVNLAIESYVTSQHPILFGEKLFHFWSIKCALPPKAQRTFSSRNCTSEINSML